MQSRHLLAQCLQPFPRRMQSPRGRDITRSACAIEPLEVRQLMSAAALDLSFDDGAPVHFDISGGWDNPQAVVVQHDGKTLIAGAAIPLAGGDREAMLVRLNADGSLDTTFGNHGKVMLSIWDSALASPWSAAPNMEEFTALTVQRDGKIVAAGTAYIGMSLDLNGGGTVFAAVRFNANGTPDETFGDHGVAIADFTAGYDDAAAVALAPGGIIIVAGTTNRGGIGDQGDFGVARFTASGTLDSAFGQGGKATANFGRGSSISSADGVSAVAVTGDGKILVAGFSSNAVSNLIYSSGFALARFNVDGSLDTGFASAGLAFRDNRGMATSLLIGDGGKILVAGHTPSGLAVLRYNSDGSADSSFGAGGNVAIPANAAASYTLRLRDDGAIAALGGDNMILISAAGTAQNTISLQRPLDAPYQGSGVAAFAPGGKVMVIAATSHQSPPAGSDGWDAWRQTVDLMATRFDIGGNFVEPANGFDSAPSNPGQQQDQQKNVDPPAPPPAASDISAALSGKTAVKGGKFYKFTVTYISTSRIDPATWQSPEVAVAGPNDFTGTPDLLKIKQNKTGTKATVTYSVAAPGGAFDAGDNGVYTVSHTGDVQAVLGARRIAVSSAAGGTSVLGQFEVSIRVRPSRPASHHGAGIAAGATRSQLGQKH